MLRAFLYDAGLPDSVCHQSKCHTLHSYSRSCNDRHEYFPLVCIHWTSRGFADNFNVAFVIDSPMEVIAFCGIRRHDLTDEITGNMDVVRASVVRLVGGLDVSITICVFLASTSIGTRCDNLPNCRSMISYLIRSRCKGSWSCRSSHHHDIRFFSRSHCNGGIWCDGNKRGKE